MPKESALYDYLEKSGILAHGTPEEIRETKKEYWKLHRKEWRKQQRKKCKSYTVFLTPAECKLIQRALSGQKDTMTGFIRRSALHAAEHKTALIKEIVGKIREHFFEHYAAIEALTEDTRIPKALIDLERNVLNLIK